MPYLAPEAAMPITSCAPRFAERNARPAIHAGIERPELRKSALVRCEPRSHQPIPTTKRKYTARMR
jgi:hypothetical protein